MSHGHPDKVSQQFYLARLWLALVTCYGMAWALVQLLIWLTSDDQGTQWQLAFLVSSGLAAASIVVMILLRPKPSSFPTRTHFTVFEYVLVALMLAMAGLLWRHPGWHLSAQPPQGLLATLWGLGYVAAWVGPQTISLILVAMAHWLGLQWYLDYRLQCWRWLDEQTQLSLKAHIQQALGHAPRLSKKDAEYAAHKLARWYPGQARGGFTLSLPGSGVVLSANHDSDKRWQYTLADIENPAQILHRATINRVE